MKGLREKYQNYQKQIFGTKHDQNIEDQDRISNLPDAVLQHILGSIELKQAVQTSILSKRWKNLWSSLPDLDFNFRRLASLSRTVNDLPWFLHEQRFMPGFKHFVSQFLSHRDDSSTICKFKIFSDVAPADSRFVEKCLEYAINHAVQTLDINIYCSPTPFKFPVSVFVTKTLKTLRLKQYTKTVVIPKPFILPNLNTLYLECFHFDGKIYSFSKEPFSGLPNLEKLTLHRCDVSGLIISASKLRVLEISFQDPLFSREAKMEQISAPGLVSFRYVGYVSLVCPKMDIFPCLEEVYVDNFANLEPPYTDDIEKKMPVNLIRMLQQLGNAKFVTLTLHTIEVLAMDPDLLEQSRSPFPHIRNLKLTRRRYGFHSMDKVPQNVMNYLTKGSSYGDSLVVEFPQGIKT